MPAIVTRVKSVSSFGENLSQVDLENGQFIIANKKEDGSFRWQEGEVAVYVTENSVVPDDILKDRGYWNDEKNIGLLGGKKGNKVKGRNFGPEDDRRRSVGLLFKMVQVAPDFVWDGLRVDGIVSHPFEDMDREQNVQIGDDVSVFFGISE